MSITRNRESIKLTPRRYDTAGIPTRYFNPGELEAFLHLVEEVQPAVVVEFGVNNGRNPLAVLRNIQSVQIYVGVDVPPGYEFPMVVQKNEIPAVPGELVLDDKRFILVLRKRGTFDMKPQDFPEADVVFIDADHSREGVLNDRRLAQGILRPGGRIIYHDDNCLSVVQVTQTLNELAVEGAKITHVADTWLAYEDV